LEVVGDDEGGGWGWWWVMRKGPGPMATRDSLGDERHVATVTAGLLLANVGDEL
jgi:hypothetical protein